MLRLALFHVVWYAVAVVGFPTFHRPYYSATQGNRHHRSCLARTKPLLFLTTALKPEPHLLPQLSDKIESVLNGQSHGISVDKIDRFVELEHVNVTIDESDLLPCAPALSFNKYLTMQDKRVVVTIRYSENAGLRPYYLTVAKKLTNSHPDIIIERRILPKIESADVEATFEILVDNKVVVGKGRSRKAKIDSSRAPSVFVSMQAVEMAVSRARRKRRPSTLYGDDKVTLRLNMLRKASEQQASSV